VEALRSTRQALGVWTPPETALGFRITRAAEATPAPVLRPVAWWRQPLPAWAQAAAAVMIFAAGLTIGARQQPSDEPAVARSTTNTMPTAAPVAIAQESSARAETVSRDEVATLEQRLRAVEMQRAAAPREAPVSSIDEAAVLERVAAMIEASEQRQRLQSVRLAQAVDAVAENFELRRRADLERVERRIGQVYTPAEEMLRQHNEALTMLVSSPQRGSR
jgi:hypothetical protein